MEEDVLVAKHDRPNEEPAYGSCSPRPKGKTVQQTHVKALPPRPIADGSALFSMRGRA
jgi:hypothetical protein